MSLGTPGHAGERGSRPVRQLRAVLLGLLLVVAGGTVALAVLKQYVDRRVDARVYDETVRRVEERLAAGQAQAADDTALAVAQARPAFRERLAWALMDQAPALPRFMDAVREWVTPPAPARELLALELTLRRRGSGPARRLAADRDPASALGSAFRHYLGLSWSSTGLFHAARVPDPVPVPPGTSMLDAPLDYLDAAADEEARRPIPPAHRGRQLVHLGRYGEARASLLEAWEQAQTPDVAYLLGYLAEAGGDALAAAQWHARAVRLGPHRRAAAALVRLAEKKDP